MGAFLILRTAFKSFRAIFGSLGEKQEQSGFIVPGAPDSGIRADISADRNRISFSCRPEPDFSQLPAGIRDFSAGRNP